VRIEPDLAGEHFANRFDDQFRGSLLEHDARAAELHCLDEFALVLRGGEDDYFWFDVELLESLECCQTVHIRHAEIEHNDIGPGLLDDAKYLAAVRSFADHGDIFFENQQFLQAIPHNRMVISQHDAYLRRSGAFGSTGWGRELETTVTHLLTSVVLPLVLLQVL
jgi:hypothetical protein